ncbi:inositol-tetrakisphosphate 1-kinase 6 isoform X1 [Telopea speciosissima]|uniref:inositol-tetrakisphosphate 1-kinase 6 isoform X1 n=2 Tax=Telopea speciosissima TaxID=54955 RepID=UPI001CC57DD6|nr:inositol-tetrakisphosphate 1-kinase 6 isoform X1 [Telopea speciosissima]XP_043695023.1 inositol-tetrakisphosphate 1-kinase 6 isoform X1 [Telopea speciosissima]
MVAVRGILLNELVLFVEDDEGNLGFQSGAEVLLRRLKYSNLRVGICYAAGVSTQKMAFLKSAATLYLLDVFMWNASSVDDAINEILLSWGDIGGSCFYVATCEDKDLTLKISNHGWLPVVKRTVGVNTEENSKLLLINKLEELPLTICHFNRKGTGSSVVTVGYMMKPSREEDFAKRGAFPMYPTQNGLIFVPLIFDLPLESQLQEVDVVLHKATDEILTIELSSSSEFSNKISYSKGMQELERYLQHHPDCCVIDPLNNIYPVLDRLRIEEILLGLEDLNREGRCRIRAPHFVKVDNFKEANLGERLLEAKLYLPSIVKPQVACGVADAHSMAITFRIEDFEDLSVPLPSVIQEYVDHSSLLFKFYVLGEKVFHAVKKSTPNADVLFSSYEKNGLKPITFDSLKSLPTAKEDKQCRDEVTSKTNKHALDLGLVTDAANWLKRTLDLTIFGFDVVIQEGSGDHVIVDVNYLPSFKELPNDVAIPAFWDAVKASYESRRTS